MTAGVIGPFISVHPAALGVWIATWLAWITAERAHHTRRRREGATVSDRNSHLVFFACLAPAIILLALSRKIAPGATIKPPIAAFVVGEIVFIAGAGIRLWAVRTLGEYFTTTVQTSTQQPVIRTGPYRFVRHPS